MPTVKLVFLIKCLKQDDLIFKSYNSYTIDQDDPEIFLPQIATTGSLLKWASQQESTRKELFTRVSPVGELLRGSSYLFDWHHPSAVEPAAQVSCRPSVPVSESLCPCMAAEKHCYCHVSFESYLQDSWGLTVSSQVLHLKQLEVLSEFAPFSLKSSGNDMLLICG